jgi:hypothetical protein
MDFGRSLAVDSPSRLSARQSSSIVHNRAGELASQRALGDLPHGVLTLLKHYRARPIAPLDFHRASEARRGERQQDCHPVQPTSGPADIRSSRLVCFATQASPCRTVGLSTFFED